MAVHTEELAHALLAAEADDRVPLDYAEEELVVESVTYTVAGSLGLRVDGYAIPTSRRGRRKRTWRSSTSAPR